MEFSILCNLWNFPSATQNISGVKVILINYLPPCFSHFFLISVGDSVENTSITIKSAANDRYKLDGGGHQSDFFMFGVYGHFEATFMDLDVVNGYSSLGGAAFYVSGAGQLTLINVALSNHNSSHDGGAIYYDSVHHAGLIMNNSNFTDCVTTAQGGGAIYVGASTRNFYSRTIAF